MATAPILPVVSVDEYLNSSYTPDMEYVDGVLIERSVPTIPHSVLQMILIQFFSQFQERLRFMALPEVRTQIIERARYRIPDVVLCSLPLPKGKILDTVPGAIIEILSPTDRMGETLDRFRDYSGIGVLEIVQMDPDHYVAHRYKDGSLLRADFHDLPLTDREHRVPFPSQELFDRLRAALAAE
jgi:Uma2 family endonuclease